VQETYGGGGDLFVAKLSPSGNALVYSTYLGGSAGESVSGQGIAVPVRGTVYVAGGTASSDFPTVDAQQPTFGGNSSDAFVAKLDETTAVAIDIRPGDSPNDVNPKSKGKIAVAILSGSSFDAPAVVNRSSLTFGRTGDEVSWESCDARAVDVNGDGLPDLVCHFSTAMTALQPGDTGAVLKGETLDGLPILGKDAVTVVPARGSVAVSRKPSPKK